MQIVEMISILNSKELKDHLESKISCGYLIRIIQKVSDESFAIQQYIIVYEKSK